VSAILKRRGVRLRNRSPEAAEIEQAIRLYDSGLCVAAIGAQLGFHGRTVWSALRIAGVQMRDTTGRKL
jgi:hypothetical protein